MCTNRIMIACGMFVVLCATTGQTQEKIISMIPVKYDGLKQEVLKQRGKVVLVDFWASFCFPCKKAFPHFIEMQKKYAGKGLVVITVSVDSPEDPQKVELANAYLRQVNSPFINLLLNEPAETWTKKLDFVSLPCYYLFDRQGRWTRFGGVESEKGVNYDDLEKTVVRMLDEN